MDILNLLLGQLDNQNIINELGASTGADPDKIQKLIKLGIPKLMEAMGKNASSSQGATSLANALDQHKGDQVDDVKGFLKNVDIQEGSKMLEHILASDNKKIQDHLSEQTGLKKQQVSIIMAQLAPLLIGVLAKQKTSKSIDVNDLSSMLGGLMGSQSGGKIMDGIGKVAGGFFNKK